jgi:hypothetical protein
MPPGSTPLPRAPHDEDATADGIRPDARLIRRAKLIAGVAAICLAVTALIDLVSIAVFALRVGSVAGLENGGFSFVVDPWAGELVPQAFVPITHFAIWQSVLATLLLTLRLVPGLVVLWNLFGLFNRYGQGLVFTTRNERHVRNIAWALLAYAAVPLLTHATLYLAGMSAVAIKLEIRQLDAAVVGVILFALTYVMSFGGAIDRDREGFV